MGPPLIHISKPPFKTGVIRNAGRCFSTLGWEIKVASFSPLQFRISGTPEFDAFRSIRGRRRNVDLATVLVVHALLGLVERHPDFAKFATLNGRIDLQTNPSSSQRLRSLERRVKKHLQDATYLGDEAQQAMLREYAALHSHAGELLTRPPLPSSLIEGDDQPSSTGGGISSDFPDAPVPSTKALLSAVKYVLTTASWQLKRGPAGSARIEPGRGLREMLAYRDLTDERAVARALVAVTLKKLALRRSRERPGAPLDDLRDELRLEIMNAASLGYAGLLGMFDRRERN